MGATTIDDRFVEGYHVHKCGKCKHVWKHADADQAPKRDHRKAHTCPACGHFEFDNCWQISATKFPLLAPIEPA